MQSNQVDFQKIQGGVISSILPGSIASSLSLQKGDVLTHINGRPLQDILDYRFQIAEEEIECQVSRATSQGSITDQFLFEIEKEYDEDLGIEFEDVLFDRIRRCKNNCDFCFIYQLPKKMRRSLYIKDDDYRLSFLYGNYVTLAGLDQKDYDRILEYHLSPLYVSVHATDLEKRRELLRNPKAEDILEKIQYLIDHGIEVFTQAVVCPGLNDGKILEQSMLDLAKLYPGVKAFGIVPVGLTQYQSRLKRMNPHTMEEARECIQMIERYQAHFRAELGTPFAQVADEFYLKAQLPFPGEEAYEDYDLVENGIGAARSFIDDFFQAYDPEEETSEETVGIITGEDGKIMFEDFILPSLQPEHRARIKIFPVKNKHFGESVTVAGLMVGKDIEEQVPANAVSRYLLPDSCLKFDSPVFLDDLHLDQIAKTLKAPVEPVATTGQDLFEAIFEG